MTIKLGNSLNDLSKLVTKFEESELDLIKNVPQKLVNEFGYGGLANALMFQESKIPQYDGEKISEYMQTHTFNTLDSLVKYVKSVQGDINKLFAIFSWAALNINYDTAAYFSGNHKQATLESVFSTKLAVCEGYSLFVREMAKLANLDEKKIVIKPYSNYAKGYSFNGLNPPKDAKSNHASVYVQINGVPFLSEPTWAAGSIGSDKQFKKEYSPELFLIPIYKTLCDHYPCDESQKLLPIKYSYQDFLKCCKIDYCGIRLKTERIPFSNFESSNGYVEQIYSCNGPIEFVSFKIYVKKDNALQQIDQEGISSYEIIKTKLPKHPERCRFRTSIAFPDKGLYKVSMFIDGPGVVDYYVNSLQKCTTSVPLKVNLYDEPKFIPISPKTIVTSVNNGYALIRFAVAPKRSKLLWKITKLSNPNSLEKNGQEISKEFGRYITLTIPFDKERYEDQLCITFPSNGRFHVLVYLSNDAGSYTSHANYYFDVKGASSSNPKPINPSSLMFKGRTFAPAPIYDKSNNEVIIKPNQNCYFVEQKEQTLLIKTANADDNIHLELQKDNKTVIFVKQDGQEGDFKRFSWTMPDEAGEYFLEGWINKGYCISLTYIVSKDKLKEPTKEENELLDDLKSKTCEPQKAQKQEEKQKKQEQQNAETDKKKSSKCCLLI